MPAILILAIFSFLFAIMGGYVGDMVQSRQQFTQDLAKATRAYFDEIHNFVLFDMVPNALEVLPRPSGTAVAAGTAFLNQHEVRRLGPPNPASDPLRDAWNAPITALMVRENVAFDSFTVAPVTGIFLLSPGPDGVSQTSLLGVSHTITGLRNVAPAGDDILTFFTDEEVLKTIKNQMDKDLKFLQKALENDFVTKFKVYRAAKDAAYEVSVTLIPGLPAPDYEALASTDPSFPQFVSIGDDAERRRLGLEAMIEHWERTLPMGGRMLVRPISVTALTVTYGFVNDSVNMSPWPTLGPRIVIRAHM